MFVKIVGEPALLARVKGAGKDKEGFVNWSVHNTAPLWNDEDLRENQICRLAHRDCFDLGAEGWGEPPDIYLAQGGKKVDGKPMDLSKPPGANGLRMGGQVWFERRAQGKAAAPAPAAPKPAAAKEPGKDEKAKKEKEKEPPPKAAKEEPKAEAPQKGGYSDKKPAAVAVPPKPAEKEKEGGGKKGKEPSSPRAAQKSAAYAAARDAVRELVLSHGTVMGATAAIEALLATAPAGAEEPPSKDDVREALKSGLAKASKAKEKREPGADSPAAQ